MSERHFYSSQFQFEGSMDDDGYLYDERHARIGQVRDGSIYDNANIRRGYIGDDGQVQDLNHIPIGKEYSSLFNGWSGHRDGYVRNDVLGTEHGNDYGIFSLVKDGDRFGSGMDDGSNDYCDDGGMDDDSDDDEGGRHATEDGAAAIREAAMLGDAAKDAAWDAAVSSPYSLSFTFLAHWLVPDDGPQDAAEALISLVFPRKFLHPLEIETAVS